MRMHKMHILTNHREYLYANCVVFESKNDIPVYLKKDFISAKLPHIYEGMPVVTH